MRRDAQHTVCQHTVWVRVCASAAPRCEAQKECVCKQDVCEEAPVLGIQVLRCFCSCVCETSVMKDRLKEIASWSRGTY